MFVTRKIATVAALCMCLVLIAGGFSSVLYAADYQLIAGGRQPEGFSEAGPASLSVATRWRAVDLAPALASPNGIAEGDTLALNLFPDVAYASRVDRVTTNASGTVTVRARIDGSPLAYALISTTGDRSLVEIEIPEKNEHFIISSDAEGDHYLADVSAVALDELEGGPSLVPPAEYAPTAPAEVMPMAGGPLDPATVDVLIAYTPAARTWANASGGGINNVIAQAMAKGQLACDNSNTLLTLRLVYSAEVAYTEAGSSSTDLARLQNTTDGYLDTVHTWRNQYAADVVTLLTKMEDTGGLGYLLNTTAGLPTWAFNLCRVQQSGWTYTVVHEQGHNMGGHHHKSQNVQPGPGLFSYSAGGRWVGNNGGRYCSVMTYEAGTYFSDGQTHTRVAYWSNPSITYQGQPTGQADADNARTIREIKHVIAGYRSCIAPSVTTHPVSQIAFAGQSVTFTVAASGTWPLSYQWRRGATNVGANSPSLTINPVTTADAGSYTCVITNGCNYATSNAATLTVNPHAYGVRISDLTHSPTPPNPIKVWGKVVSISPIKLSDGRAEITVTGIAASVGDLWVVTGNWNGTVLAALSASVFSDPPQPETSEPSPAVSGVSEPWPGDWYNAQYYPAQLTAWMD